MKIALLVLFAVAFSGCAGVADNRGMASLSIVVKNAAAPLVGERVRVSAGNQNKEAVTDKNGEAKIEFTYLWNSYFWIIPPLGSLPRRSAKPDYLIRVAGREIAVRSDFRSTSYDAQRGTWNTTITIDVEKEPNQSPDPTSWSITPRADARVAPLSAVGHL